MTKLKNVKKLIIPQGHDIGLLRARTGSEALHGRPGKLDRIQDGDTHRLELGAAD